MFKLFQPYSNTVFGISQKADGQIELADENLSTAKNRNGFFVKVGIDPNRVVSPIQSHSINVVKINSDELNPEADGVVSNSPETILSVTVADCFPIYFYDPINSTIGLAHSGWRGTVGNIAAEVIKTMESEPKNVLVGIGPGIQACHFEIKEDILSEFKKYPKATVIMDNKIFIDLPKIITRQLIEVGVLITNIESFGECTYCKKEKYFSFRRDKPEFVEAMLAYIGIN